MRRSTSSLSIASRWRSAAVFGLMTLLAEVRETAAYERI